ncbi:hypothetical protein LXA43DRAFT_1061998 [Ganoderma leucocontextum]|nr:hypothetical protein LXA43DRAFT_1061998 [Ganoderma leucocontextum]
MRPDKHKRWRHIRILRLDGEPLSPHIAEAFARVIPRASQLEHLEFEHAETTLRTHPDLPLAFAALRTVKHIVIYYGSQYTCRMLEAMHWPLESAELNHTDDDQDWQDPDTLDRMHPAVLLKNSRTTLKTLECKYWTKFNYLLDTYPVYPQLESLRVEGAWCPRTAQWTVSYPSLKRLSVETIDAARYSANIDEDHFARHAANRSFNLEEHMVQEQQWSELEQFIGHNALDLYLLGFTCRIRDIVFSLSPESLPFFAPVMERARPTRLGLSITSSLFSQPVPTYLEDPGLTDIKSLELHVKILVTNMHGDTGDIDVDRFLGYVRGTLQRASAREFALFLEVDNITWLANLRDSLPGIVSFRELEQTERALRSSPTVPLSRVETWVDNADLDALARGFLDEVPSLEWVKLSIQPSASSEWKSAQSSRGRGADGQLKNAPPLAA